MPFFKLLYPLLGLYWLVALLVLVAWRKQLCGSRFEWMGAARPVAYSRELETRARYFNLLFWVLMLAFVPVYTTLSYARFRGPLAVWLLTVAGAVLTVVSVYNAYRQLTAIRRLRLERDDNLVVAQRLRKAASFEHHLFHDLPAGHIGYIDHVLIGPAGVFALVTRTIGDRPEGGGLRDRVASVDGLALTFSSDPGTRDTRATSQAARLAQWLQTWLGTEAGEYVAVQPVLVLPGWRIESKRAGQVAVVDESGAAGLLKGRRVLSPTRIHRVAAHLDGLGRRERDAGRPRASLPCTGPGAPDQPGGAPPLSH